MVRTERINAQEHFESDKNKRKVLKRAFLVIIFAKRTYQTGRVQNNRASKKHRCAAKHGKQQKRMRRLKGC